MTLWYRTVRSISDKRREAFLRWLHRRLAMPWNDCDVGIIHFRADSETTVVNGTENPKEVHLASGDQIKITFAAEADVRFQRKANTRHPKET